MPDKQRIVYIIYDSDLNDVWGLDGWTKMEVVDEVGDQRTWSINDVVMFDTKDEVMAVLHEYGLYRRESLEIIELAVMSSGEEG